MTFTGLFLIQFLKTPALIPNADFVKTIYGVFLIIQTQSH